jgi:mannose-1-phosphate guanylyltransferase
VLSLGYRPDAFQAAYPDGVCRGARIHYAVEPAPLGTAGAIRFAAEHAGIDGRFVAMNGDVLTDVDLSKLLDFHDGHGGAATIHLHEVTDPSRFGVVVTDPAGRVDTFVEKPAPGTAPSRLINAGTYVLEASVLERIPAGRAVSIERETFPALAAEGALWAQDDGGVYWTDTGTPADYLRVQLDLIDGRRSARVQGVHPDALVDPGARLSRAVIGPRAAVGAEAEVRDAAVLPQAQVAVGARVVDSIIGPGAVVGRDAVVEDGTVLGGGVVVEAGATLRNVRVPDPTG